ncbi:hypothetical protein AN1V17_27770 [Vallitalea sediminicola]
MKKLLTFVIIFAFVFSLTAYANDDSIKKQGLLFEDTGITTEIENNLYNKDIVFVKMFENENAKFDYSHVVKINFLIDASNTEKNQRLSDLLIDEGRYLIPVLDEKGNNIGMAEVKKIVPLEEVSDKIKDKKSTIDLHTNHVGEWEVVKYYKDWNYETFTNKEYLDLAVDSSIESIMYVEFPIIQTKGLLYVLEDKDEFVPFTEKYKIAIKSKSISGKDVLQQLIDAPKTGDTEGSAASVDSAVDKGYYIVAVLLIISLAILATIYIRKRYSVK